MKKIIVVLVVIVVVIDASFICVNAKNVFKADVTSTVGDSQVKYNNIAINNEFTGKSAFVVDDISKGFGECIYNKTNVIEVKVKFYHKLSTTAYKVKNGKQKEYCLGLSENYAEDNFCRVKYLPQGSNVDGLNDSMYIKHKKLWQKCIFQNDRFKFIPLEDELNNELEKYRDKIIDYGVNIYASNDGEQFKRLDTELKIEKISPDVMDAVSCGTDYFYERLYAKVVPKDVRYIKIQINEVAEFLTDDGESIEGESMAFVSSIKFTLNTDDDNEDEVDKNSKKISNVTQEKAIGDVEEEVIYKLRKPRKKVVYIDSEDEIIPKIKVPRRPFVGASVYNEDSVEEKKVYRRKKPYKKKKKVFYIDEDDNVGEVANVNEVKKRKHKNVGKIKENNLEENDNFINDLQYSNVVDVQPNTSNIVIPTKNKLKKLHNSNKKLKKKFKRKSAKKFNYLDSDIMEAQMLEAAAENIRLDDVENDGVGQSGTSEILINEAEQQIEEDRQAKVERTISKIYLSGLLLALGSVFTYDKLGFLKRLFIR